MKELKTDLRQFLMTSKQAHTQSGDEWFDVRCPFCGDSDTSDKPHLSIRIPKTDDIFYFQCFQLKCDVHRYPKYSDFIRLGYTNLQLLEQFSKSSQIVSYEKKILDISEGMKYPVAINKVCEEYIKKRTGIIKSHYPMYKIVGNVPEFIKLNELNEFPLTKFNLTEDNCIGFLNKGNTRLNVRKINKKEFRIVDLVKAKRMFEEHMDFEYRTENFDYKREPVIVITESNFDRINSIKQVGEEGLYITGLSFLGIFRVFKKYSKKYHDVRWIIISDNDVDISKYKKNILNKYDYRVKSLEVWYNTKEKDIGDISKPIEFIKHVLK